MSTLFFLQIFSFSNVRHQGSSGDLVTAGLGPGNGGKPPNVCPPFSCPKLSFRGPTCGVALCPRIPPPNVFVDSQLLYPYSICICQLSTISDKMNEKKNRK